MIGLMAMVGGRRGRMMVRTNTKTAIAMLRPYDMCPIIPYWFWWALEGWGEGGMVRRRRWLLGFASTLSASIENRYSVAN
jgi:hypothetical protein